MSHKSFSVSGRNKREIFFDPLRRENPWQISYLRESAEYISKWYSSNPSPIHCLTPATYGAVRQTLMAIADLCESLFTNQDCFYLLLGKFSSDPIEARFGAYRQMAGANYYISCKQLFEAEKKLRTLNLIKSHVDISHLDISYGHEDHSEMNCDLNFDDVGFEEIDNMDVVEQSTVYYVAGYVGRSISRRNKCRDCKSLLVESDENDAALLDDKHLILNDLNRGGLSLPSDFCYTVCLFSYLFYRQLEETNRRKTFLCSRNQRNTFLSNVLKNSHQFWALKSHSINAVAPDMFC